jgi:hypothetical protein
LDAEVGKFDCSPRRRPDGTSEDGAGAAVGQIVQSSPSSGSGVGDAVSVGVDVAVSSSPPELDSVAVGLSVESGVGSSSVGVDVAVESSLPLGVGVGSDSW